MLEVGGGGEEHVPICHGQTGGTRARESNDLPCPKHRDPEQEEDGVFEPREARLARPSGLVAVGIVAEGLVGGRAPLLEGVADALHCAYVCQGVGSCLIIVAGTRTRSAQAG